MVALRSEIALDRDLAHFQTALAAARATTGPLDARHRSLRAAVALYEGDLLDAEPAEWAVAAREALRQACATRSWSWPISTWPPGGRGTPCPRSGLAADPADEAAHRALIPGPDGGG